MDRKGFIRTVAATVAGAFVGARLLGKSEKVASPGASSSWATDDWDEVRALFPLRTDPTYLNTGGLGPASQPALDAVLEQNRRKILRAGGKR